MGASALTLATICQRADGGFCVAVLSHSAEWVDGAVGSGLSASGPDRSAPLMPYTCNVHSPLSFFPPQRNKERAVECSSSFYIIIIFYDDRRHTSRMSRSVFIDYILPTQKGRFRASRNYTCTRV